MASRITIFVTGANTGLGLYTVKALYRSTNAYNILLGARDLNKATSAIEEVKQEYPDSTSSIEPIQVDLESDASIAQAYEAISKKYDKIDVLLNNAGMNKGTLTSSNMS
jgi:NADP-dependent 3-hydroxy acid dehydrogenase YdfG